MAKKRFKSDAPLPPGASYKNAPKAPLFDDETRKSQYDYWFNPVVGGEVKGHGLVPRDYARYPKEMFAPPSEIKLRPRSEWSALCKEKTEKKSWLTQLRDRADDGKPVPSLDQDGKGYCVLPETPVLLANGDPRPAELVRVRDHVRTAEGNQGVVTRTTSRLVAEPVVYLTVEGGGRLLLTGEHPVLTDKGYLPAWCLKPGAKVASNYPDVAYLPVQATERRPYKGPVYNFEVEGDHSYVAGGVGVHNCWGHSSTQAVMLSRMARNDPYVPLSAYMVCAVIKGGRDEGGWCGLSAKFIKETGVCTQARWPQGEMNVRQYDTADMRAEAAKFKILGDWVDLTRDVYDQNLTLDQVATLLFDDVPCPVDFNWWSHSVCAVEVVEVESGSFGLKILNSWSDGWGERGCGVLRGNKAIPDGALGVRTTGAAA